MLRSSDLRPTQGVGFDGFVRSDLKAVVLPAAAFGAGLNLLKPASVAALTRLVDTGKLHVSALDSAVDEVLTPMFAFGLVAHPLTPAIRADALTAGHAAVALSTAERSMVLLKDDHGVLPLSQAQGSVAVIGSDADKQVVTGGLGSSDVFPPFVSTPLDAIRSAVAGSTQVTYTPGDSPDLRLPLLTRSELVEGSPLPVEDPSQTAEAQERKTEPGKRDVHIDLAPNFTKAAGTAVKPGIGPGWSTWNAVLVVPKTGTYQVAAEQDGDTWLTVNGRPLISSPGLHARSRWATTVHLVAGRRYTLVLHWYAVTREPNPQMGLADVTPEIDATVAAAKKATTVVVFVGERDSEGVDQPDLSLPGDADPLISAVAAANPHTVLVLNTGGAVLMPWINRVAAALEAWYPGEEDGAATAAVLTGKIDPSGHLPVTFPAPDILAPSLPTRSTPASIRPRPTPKGLISATAGTKPKGSSRHFPSGLA